jgi:hypothetical protein
MDWALNTVNVNIFCKTSKITWGQGSNLADKPMKTSLERRYESMTSLNCF